MKRALHFIKDTLVLVALGSQIANAELTVENLSETEVDDLLANQTDVNANIARTGSTRVKDS